MLLQDSEWHAGMSLLTLAWGNKLRPEHVWAAAKEFPAAVNETDACGATVLHVAAVYANLEAVEALLAAGVDPNARTAAPTHIVYTYIEPGSAPLHFAVHHDIPHACLEHNPLSDVLSAKAGIVQALLAAGADAAAANSAGCTPLHSLASTVYWGGWDEWEVNKRPRAVDPLQEIAGMVSALLAAGASLGVASEEGWTPKQYLLGYVAEKLGVAATAQLTGVPPTELEEL